MACYEQLAQYYDELTRDVDYARWADYYETFLRECPHGGHTVLDLGCGTGSLCWELARRGYETIGVDCSEDMLMAASSKSGAGVLPMFLMQEMDELDLYGTVDAAICMLDGVNYVTEPDRLREVFRRVHLFLEPCGAFVFDINTPCKLRGMDGEVYLDETEDVFCVWRSEFDAQSRLSLNHMDIFYADGAHWQRSEENHLEYAYEPAELCSMLQEAGFCSVEQFGELSRRKPEPEEQRIFFRARKAI